jgi:hypothetical protein
MNRLLAVTGVVAVALGACAAPVARPTTSPTIESISSSHPSSVAPSLKIDPVAMPPEVWGDWEADTTTTDAIAPNDRIQLSINWQDGLTAWVQTPSGGQVLQGASTSTNPGEIRLVATDSVGGCSLGDEGEYGWKRSADGLFLTLTPLQDACPLRATTLGRAWVHSLGAVNDGGRGVAGFDAAFEVTLPNERFAMSGPEGVMDIHSDAGYQLVTVENPAGYREPCSPAAVLDTFGIEPTADAFITYLRGLPGIIVKTTNIEVDGHRAVHVAITSKASSDCPPGEVFVYRPDNSAADADITVAPGSQLSLWVVEVPSNIYVFRYGGPSVTSAGEELVISTIHFIDKLPTS